MLNMECCLQFFKIHIGRPLFYARNFPFWLSNYLDQTSIYLWTLTRFPNVCRSADQLFDFSVRGLEKRRSYRNRWTPIVLDGKQQQMLWQCLLSPFFAVYLKLNYVEKVMKREIGNGFSDEATSSTWLAKSKKLKKWTCEFDFCIGKRHQQYISTISCFSMMFLCIWKCWSSFGLCFITR